MRVIVTGGTILSGKNSEGFLSPKHDISSLTAIAKKYHKNIRKHTEERIYYKDSQEFDLPTDGKRIEKALQDHPKGNLVIVTGTDTVEWLGRHVANLEKGTSERKVVILSSMYDPDTNPEHVANLYFASQEFVEQNEHIENGVYTMSAIDKNAERINVFNAKKELTKVSCAGIDKIHGKKKSCKLFVSKDNVFCRNIEDVAAEKEDENLLEFIGGSQIKLLPLIARNRPQTIREYYAGLSEGDIAIIEMDDSYQYDSTHYKTVQDLSDRGIKVILSNRSYYNEESDKFEQTIDDHVFNLITQKFSDLKNVYITNEPSNFYARLAKSDQSALSFPLQLSQNSVLGIRYLPNQQIVANTLNNLGECPNVILETMPGGVFPEKFLEQINTGKESNISLHPAYQEIMDQEKKYASSANEETLKNHGMKMFPCKSARDQMLTLSKRERKFTDDVQSLVSYQSL